MLNLIGLCSMDPCLKRALKLSVLRSRSNNNLSMVKPPNYESTLGMR